MVRLTVEVPGLPSHGLLLSRKDIGGGDNGTAGPLRDERQLETEILSSVSSANLDLVRALYADWERGDWSSVEWAHPEIEFVIADGPTPGSWKGLPGMVEGFRGVLSAWEDWRTEAEEYRELDNERVLVLIHLSGRGKTSGVEVGHMRASGANLFHISGGKVTRLVIYWNREQALADLASGE